MGPWRTFQWVGGRLSVVSGLVGDLSTDRLSVVGGSLEDLLVGRWRVVVGLSLVGGFVIRLLMI